MRMFSIKEFGSNREEHMRGEHDHEFHLAWTDCTGGELTVSMECAHCAREVLLAADLDEQDADCPGRSPLADGGPWRRREDGTIEEV